MCVPNHHTIFIDIYNRIQYIKQTIHMQTYWYKWLLPPVKENKVCTYFIFVFCVDARMEVFYGSQLEICNIWAPRMSRKLVYESSGYIYRYLLLVMTLIMQNVLFGRLHLFCLIQLSF